MRKTDSGFWRARASVLEFFFQTLKAFADALDQALLSDGVADLSGKFIHKPADGSVDVE
jgi:hypothetical protein